MRKLLFVLACSLLPFSAVPLHAQNYCDGCTVVEEFGMRGFQIGGQYRLDGGEPVIVDQIDGQSNQVLVHFPGYSQTSWVHADRLYTGQHAFERSQKFGLAASCATYAAAVKDGSFLQFVFRGACCESSAAKRYGSPPGLC